MSITYKPSNELKKLASKKNIKKLVTKNLTPNKVVLNALDRSGVSGKQQLERVALKVMKKYKKKVKELRDAGMTKADAIKQVTKDPKLLVQRIQNETVSELTGQIKEQYHGEFYEWLPSTAKVPDEEHMLKYGKRFQLGKGESPGDRFGCLCGMEILVDEKRLTLE